MAGIIGLVAWVFGILHGFSQQLDSLFIIPHDIITVPRVPATAGIHGKPFRASLGHSIASGSKAALPLRASA
jgi:hypothetical protein